jgi:hypothetical protein
MPKKNQSRSAANDSPVSVAYFYKIKWGCQDEFVELFRKNHYPLLAAQVKSGRLLRVEIYVPRFHGDGRSDWTFLTVLVYKDWQALAKGESSTLAKKLYPDQKKYMQEERRRFELVEAHWDVPLTPLEMK